MQKTKIVLDADVLLHFAAADRLAFLPSIFSEFDFIVLSSVYDEVKTIQRQIDSQIQFIGNIRKEMFAPSGEMRREFTILKAQYGVGESSCMAYCRYTNNVIGSSNLRDIREYCGHQSITYLTTLDFLYYAFVRRLMTKEDCDEFIRKVISKGSKLPVVDISRYSPNAIL